MSNKVKNMRSWLLMLFAAISLGVSAQTITVKGNVKDTTGEPIIGASVVEKGNTTNGTITDLDGNYSIKVPSKATLTISYIGMKTQDIAVKGQSQINVTLSDDTQALDEVVVIGYGTVAENDLTGSVSSVSAKHIAAIPVSSASEALQGKMAGVSITTTEGSPDADVKIRVRGGGSLSQDNSPLYIVDGFPVSSISDIAPTDIQSVDVLKDASSTAIYGARGANGVIIITTKSGQEGKIQVNLGASFGVRKVTKMVDVLNPYEYVLWQQEIDQEGMKYGMFDDLDIYKSMKGTDYQDEIFGRTGNQQQYNVSVSGGNKDTKFSVSYAHNEEKSIMLGSGFSKENINAKLNTNINKWLTMDFNARFSYQTIDGISGGADANESSAANSLISRSVIYKPVEEINTTSSDSDDDENVNNAQYNPLERLNATYKKQTRLQQNYNVGLNWKPIKGLTFRSEFGYGWRYNNTDQVWGVEATSNSKYGYYGQPQALLNKVVNKNWRNANTVTYDTKFLNNTHKLNVMLGHEVSSSYDHETINTSVAFSKYMTISDVLSGMSNGTALPTSTYIGFKDNLLSFFGRVNYTIQDKYLMTFTMRADGSSKFSKGNQWGYFPSLALAWRISDEAWMERSKEWLSNLKLRLSVGTAGNNRIKSGAINSTFSLAETSDKNIYFNETSAVVLQHASNLSNPDLKWETTLTRNLGIDFGFWNNRLSGSIDAYWNTTKDLLMNATIPSSTGFSTQYKNFGQTSNKGIELALDAVIVDTKDFGLNANFNISYNRAKIDKLAGGQTWQSSNWGGKPAGQNDFFIEEGGRLGEVYGYELDGFYTTDDFSWDGSKWILNENLTDPTELIKYNNFGPGSLKLKADEDGKYTKKRLGNTVPTVTGGFGINMRYKNFDLSAFFNYSLGNKIVNATKLGSSYYNDTKKGWNLNDNFTLAKRYSWIDPSTGENMLKSSYIKSNGLDYTINRLNEINAGASMYNPGSITEMPLLDWAVEDGSFLRVNNISIGYTLPKVFINKMFMQNVRIYVTGYNLYCFTKYSGADPEVDTRRSTPMTPGVDYSAYPKSRSFVGGINVTF